MADLGLAHVDKVKEPGAINALHGDDGGGGGGGGGGSGGAQIEWTPAGGTPAYMAPGVIREWVKAKGLTGLLEAAMIDGPAAAAAAAAALGAQPQESSLAAVARLAPAGDSADGDGDDGGGGGGGGGGTAAAIAAAQVSRRTLWVTAVPVDGDDDDVLTEDGKAAGDGGGEEGKRQVAEPTYMKHVRAAEASKRTSRPSTGPGGIAWHAPDAYAFACIMWEVFTLRPLWGGKNSLEIWTAVQRGERPAVRAAEVTAAPQEFAQAYVRLMTACWAQNPTERPQMDVVVHQLDRFRGKLLRRIHKHSRNRKKWTTR